MGEDSHRKFQLLEGGFNPAGQDAVLTADVDVGKSQAGKKYLSGALKFQFSALPGFQLGRICSDGGIIAREYICD